MINTIFVEHKFKKKVMHCSWQFKGIYWLKDNRTNGSEEGNNHLELGTYNEHNKLQRLSKTLTLCDLDLEDSI